MDKAISEDIDIIRGIAALGVIVGHSLYCYKALRVLDGAFWVWIFFIVSGYLQGSAFFSGRYALNFSGVKKFWINRGLRILPLFWFVLALGFIANFVLGQPLSGSVIVREFFAATSQYTLVGPFWTIAIEMQFYLLVPLLVFLFKKVPGDLFTVMFFVICYWLHILSALHWDVTCGYPQNVLGNLVLFAAGMAIAAYQAKPRLIHWALKAFVVFCFLGGAWYVSYRKGFYFWNYRVGMTFALLSSYWYYLLKGKILV
jgi:peptidoglycan/LPS O-acetylase OafA/YrhL